MSSNQVTEPAEIFFSEVRELSLRAAETAGGAVCRDFIVAGLRVRLVFAGASLIPHVTPAFLHLAAKTNGEPDHIIRIWDTLSTGLAMIPPPWGEEAWGRRGEIEGYNTDRFRTQFNRGSNSLALYDLDAREGIFWVRDGVAFPDGFDASDDFPLHERASPMRGIFGWIMEDHGFQLMHAAAVGTKQGGALMVGKGGSGKSTTTLACLNSDLRLASDDYCIVGLEPMPYVHSLYGSAKLNLDNLDRFPNLRGWLPHRARGGKQKAMLQLGEICPEKMTDGFPLRAILCPHVAGGEDTRFELISSAKALMALAPSSIFQLPGARERAFRTMSDLVKRVPCYRMNLGTALDRIPVVTQNLLNEIGG